MLDAEFLRQFKKATERAWSTAILKPDIYGFQFQPGTRWNPGLSKAEIAEYEKTVGVRFPDDFRAFLQVLNGTDLPTLNVYGGVCEPQQTSGVYSYPRDMEIIRGRIDDMFRNRAAITADLEEQGFELSSDAGLVPIFRHRYVLCSKDPGSSAVLSIMVDSVDAIVYGDSLREYLEKEFLEHSLRR